MIGCLWKKFNPLDKKTTRNCGSPGRFVFTLLLQFLDASRVGHVLEGIDAMNLSIENEDLDRLNEVSHRLA